MRGPWPALGDKGAMIGGMPIAGRGNRQPSGGKAGDPGIQHRHYRIALRNGQGPARQEITLDIDHYQRVSRLQPYLLGHFHFRSPLNASRWVSARHVGGRKS